MAEIFIALSDLELMNQIKEFLADNGYEVCCFETGTDLIYRLKFSVPTLLLLGVKLRDKLNGIDLCRMIRDEREQRALPIFIVGEKQDDINEILAYEMGADDFVAVPFSQPVLLARIKAMLRRISVYEESSKDQEIIQVKDITIDNIRHTVTQNGKYVNLTYKEYELLFCLAVNNGKVLSRDKLLDKVWGYDYFGETRTVDVHIRSLRKVLNDDGKTYIGTVRGIGYKILE